MGYRKLIFSAMLTLFMSINRYYVAIVAGSARWHLMGVGGPWCFSSAGLTVCCVIFTISSGGIHPPLSQRFDTDMFHAMHALFIITVLQ
jgi:hypothetical protein